MMPLKFNNYTFMVLTIAGVASQTPNPNPYLWMAMAAAGGGLLIAITMLIGRSMGAPVAPVHAAAN
jgi:hypothetical protein